MSATAIIAISLNALAWAFAAGIAWSRLGAIDRRLTEGQQHLLALDESNLKHLERLARIEARCALLHSDP